MLHATDLDRTIAGVTNMVADLFATTTLRDALIGEYRGRSTPRAETRNERAGYWLLYPTCKLPADATVRDLVTAALAGKAGA